MRIAQTIGLLGIATASIVALPIPALAEDAPAAVLYARGTAKVASCFGCHGARGGGVGQFPRLAGLPVRYLAEQLTAYRDGTRSNPVMEKIARPLDDGQVQALAAYVAGLSAPLASRSALDPSTLAAGARLAALGDWPRGVPACRDCHGPALRGGGPALPGLAGQPEAYLLAQLEVFKKGERPSGPSGVMARIAVQLDPAEMKDVAAFAAALGEGEEVEIPRGEKTSWKARAQDPEHFEPPPEDALPAHAEDAAAVLLGERIFGDTPRYAPQYAGNSLSCRHCHTDRGRSPVSAPMWAAVPQYPKYRSKNRRVNTLAMRIEGCFRYSENGTPPPADSPEMAALISYMHWLATGLPIGIKPSAAGYPVLAEPGSKPDRERGRAVYAASCSVCHGETGQGSRVAGAQVIPPLWGPQSFNWGAGMHSVDKAASFILHNMPFGAVGTLTPQQAWDVAAWIDSQPRPQDPRFTESVEKTRELFHEKREYDFYGETVEGSTLGAPGTLEAWARKNPTDHG